METVFPGFAKIQVNDVEFLGGTLHYSGECMADLSNPISGFSHFGECEKSLGTVSESNHHPHPGLSKLTYVTNGMIWSENKLLTSGMLQYAQLGQEPHQSAVPWEQNGPVESFELWFWCSSDVLETHCSEVTLEDIPIIRDEYNSTEIRILAGQISGCEAPIVTQPDVLLCDLAMRRVAGNVTKYELSVPSQYSTLMIYVCQASHQNQAAVHILPEDSTTSAATWSLSNYCAGVFHPVGRELTLQLAENINGCRLIIVGGEEVDNLPSLVANYRKLQMTLFTDLTRRFASLFSSLGILILVCTFLYTKYKERLPGILQYSYLFGKLKPTFDRRLEVLRVPKSWFWYFYVVGTTTTFIMIFVEWQEAEPNLTVMILLGVFLTQAVRRLYETTCVSRFGNNQMSVTHFMVGILFHFCLPLSLQVSRTEAVSRGMWATIQFLVQVAALEFSQHIACRQLADLRKPTSGKSDEPARSAYYAPTGSMFQHITCPHYLFEIALYISSHWFLTTRWTCFSHLLIFVVANQFCSAWLNHRWYQEHFPEWAVNRFALVPYVF